MTIQILIRESQTWENGEYKKQVKEDKEERDETVPEAVRQEVTIDREEEPES